ncbi:DUF2190 family protein [Deferribacter abyssi]|uniref:DUF2190 family protein n=1 Tax=Deferribacter abyssi TaxID=213806 RepID=UPI003C2069F2
MAKNKVQSGDIINFTPSADVKSGDVIKMNDRFGIAMTDIAAGKVGAVAVVGVWEVPKATGEAWVVGQQLYWDNTNKVVTVSDGTGTNAKFGFAVEAAADTATTGIAKINA